MQKEAKCMIMQGHEVDGLYRSLTLYENMAVLYDLVGKCKYVITYKSKKVNWDLVFEAEGMLIDEIILGFSLDDYFGDGYNVCCVSYQSVG